MNEKNVNIKITAESKDAEKGINKVTSAVNKMGKSSTLKNVNNLASAVTNSISAFNTLKTAVESAAAAVEECAEAYTKQRTAELALETAAKNNPYLNDSNVSALKKYATELSKLSGIADEDLLPTMTKLAQSGRTESEIMKIMGAATDVAASGVMSFDQACDALNKTFVGEMGSLKELNPEISKMTAEELKAGKAVEAMAKAFEGTNASMGSITGGAERLKNALNGIKEEIGAGFAEPLNSFQTAIAGVLEKIAEARKAARELKSSVKEMSSINTRIAAGEDVSLDERITALRTEFELADREAEQLANTIRQMSSEWKDNKLITQDEYNLIQTTTQLKSEVTKGAFAFYNWGKNIRKCTKNIVESAQHASDYKDIQTELNELLAKQGAANRAAATAARNKAAADEEAAEAAKNESDADALIAAYKKRVEAIKSEIEARRELGEEISKQEEEEKVADAMFSGLVSLKVDGGSLMESVPGLAKFYESEKESLTALFSQMLDELTTLAKEKAETINSLIAEGIAPDDARVKDALSELAELNERIEELGGESVTVSIEARLSGVDDANEALEKLQDALKAAEPSPAEWRKLSDTFLDLAEKLDAVKGTIPDDDFERLAEQVKAAKEALAAPDLEGWQKLTAEVDDIYSRIEELQVKAQGAAAEGKLDLEKAYLEEVERLNEEAAQKAADAWDTYVSELKEKFTSMVSQISSTVSQVSSIISSACDTMLDACETRLETTLTKLEIAYLSGEMSEEEYNEAVLKAKKEEAQAEYKIEMWQWAAQILSATANIAEGVTKAIAQGGVAGIVTGSLVSAAGAIQLASIIASKPTPPTYSTGGIVGGSSYHGDHVQALLNSGEMVLNAGQQRNLFDSINSGNISKGQASGQSSQTFVQVNNKAANIVSAEPQVTENQINLAIDMRVNSSLKKGRYSRALTQAEQSKTGKWYGS